MKDISRFHAAVVEDESVRNSHILAGLIDRLAEELEKQNCRVTRIAGFCEAMPVVGNEMDIDALLISAGYIDLAPYEYGFIGGACGSYGGRIYLCGSLKYHPDGEVIRNFCKRYQKEIVELLDAPISDIGGILIK